MYSNDFFDRWRRPTTRQRYLEYISHKDARSFVEEPSSTSEPLDLLKPLLRNEKKFWATTLKADNFQLKLYSTHAVGYFRAARVASAAVRDVPTWLSTSGSTAAPDDGVVPAAWYPLDWRTELIKFSSEYANKIMTMGNHVRLVQNRVF